MASSREEAELEAEMHDKARWTNYSDRQRMRRTLNIEWADAFDALWRLALKDPGSVLMVVWIVWVMLVFSAFLFIVLYYLFVGSACQSVPPS